MSSKLERTLEIVFSTPGPHMPLLLPLPHATQTTVQVRRRGRQAGRRRMGWWLAPEG